MTFRFHYLLATLAGYALANQHPPYRWVGHDGTVLDVVDNETWRILGTSTLIQLMVLEKGKANALALASTFVPAVYNATYRSEGSNGVVAYMQEAIVSQALWQQLQQQIRQIEAHLAQIANLSEPPGDCDACCLQPYCSGECGNPVHPNHAAFQAVAALIAPTRDVHIARMNMELQGTARGVVSLHFGGSNSAYYLEPNGGVVMRHDIDLQAAQAAESAARAALAQHNITLPSNLVDGPQAMIAPGPQTMIAPGTQTMMVQVPAGLSGGQSLHRCRHLRGSWLCRSRRASPLASPSRCRFQRSRLNPRSLSLCSQ